MVQTLFSSAPRSSINSYIIICTVTRKLTGGPRSSGSIPGRGRLFCFLQNVQRFSGPHQALDPIQCMTENVPPGEPTAREWHSSHPFIPCTGQELVELKFISPTTLSVRPQEQIHFDRPSVNL